MVEDKPSFSLCAECRELASLVEGSSKKALICDRCKAALDRELAEIMRDASEEMEAFEFVEIEGFLAQVASYFLGLRGRPIFTVDE